MTNEDLQQIQALVNGARRVLVLTHANPSIDAMASALSIYLAMRKLGKDVIVAMESNPLVEVANLVGVQDVKTSLSGKNLQIVYKPYNLGDFEKVTYMEDQGQAGTLDDSFKLTITPRDGFVPDSRNFNFTFTGTAADLIFTVDVLEPSQLGRLYDAGLISTTPIINLDNHDPNKDYGKFNLVEPDAASICEIVTFFLRAVNVQFDADISGNLYQGIVAATNNFQSPRVAAATLEAAAICLRNKPKPATTQPISAQPIQQPITPQTAQPVTNSQQPTPNANGSIPSDWLGPKSFRGTSSV
jgi:nanoRNase/pAp phosphatase (c-di-AMP/oligoRNAs hydrolase)